MSWDLPTNFSNGTLSVSGIGSMIQYGNYVTDGWLAYGFLLIVWLLSFVIGIAMSSRKAILSSCFITLVFSVYFLRLDLINPILPFILLLGVIFGAIGAKEESGI